MHLAGLRGERVVMASGGSSAVAGKEALDPSGEGSVGHLAPSAAPSCCRSQHSGRKEKGGVEPEPCCARGSPINYHHPH